MREKNRSDKRDLIFQQMDATAMSYPDDKFSVVIDKGTLDALMPDTSDETQKTINKFFSVNKFSFSANKKKKKEKLKNICCN